MYLLVTVILIAFLLWLILLKLSSKIGDFIIKHIINPIKDNFKNK